MIRRMLSGQWIGAGIVCFIVLAGTIMAVQAEDQPLQSAEGRLREIEATGMAFYPGGGMPLYPGDEKWDVGFQKAPVFLAPGSVSAMAVSDPWVYVAGDFSYAGGQAASNVALWKGYYWEPLGSGIEGGRISTIAVGRDVYGNTGIVYVGGSSLQVGQYWSPSGIVYWDKWGWAPLGGGMNGTVSAIAVGGQDVYVGGCFSYAGGTVVSNIVRWQAGWHTLGRGVSGCVSAIAVSGSDIYAGGNFIAAGEGLASNIARWDGSQWSPLGSGVNGVVSKIAVSGSDVYVYGEFSQAGGQPANRLARWDGSQWYAVGSGLGSGISSLAVSGSDVYVGGSFSQIGEQPFNYIARWDGSQWQALGSGVNQRVNALAVDGSGIYVGGDFTQAGGQMMDGAAHWDGNQWRALGSGVNTDKVLTSAIAVSGSDVYIGGYFSRVGQQLVRNIVRWDGEQWYALGSGVNQSVYDIAVSGGDIYVGGNFTEAGGQTANRIARWDGGQWYPLGSGVDGLVSAIAVRGSDIYVGGAFTQAGGQPASRIARWDGSQWQTLGSGVNGTVSAIAVNGSDIYVGGSFTQAGGLPVNYIARWDGSQWHTLGSGMSSGGLYVSVHTIAVYGSDVYVGGIFSQAGGKPARDIARWDGNAWYALGDWNNDPPWPTGSWIGSVNELAISADGIYVVGDMNHVPTGAYFANTIARWDGSQWHNLGSGLTMPGDEGGLISSSAQDVAVQGDRVFVIGGFKYAGNKISRRFAIWHTQPEITISNFNGGPGTTFAITGRYFLPGSSLSMKVNGYQVTGSSALFADDSGAIDLKLVTHSQNRPGAYQVTLASGALSGSVEYQLANGLPVQPSSYWSTGQTFFLPPAFTVQYLPVVQR